jgi:cytochrome P450
MSGTHASGYPGPAAARPGTAREPPATSLADLAGLVGSTAAGFARSPRRFSFRLTFRAWARRMMTRYRSENLVLNLGVKRILLVGGRELSQEILAARPERDGYAAGALKHDAMAFLAPHALTISHDADWVRLRDFNERVLDRDIPSEFRQAFLTHVRRAFSAVPEDAEDVRAGMGRAMLAIVFGEGVAPPRLVADIQALIAVVQSPIRRRLLGRWERKRRERFYDALRQAWRVTATSGAPSLLALAHREAGDIPQEQVLEQVPHWMFTFTGSGTDLLVRTLALITSHGAVHERAKRELDAAGPLDRAGAVDAVTYLEACLMESARLYPPVTRTFHRTRRGATAGDVRIPAGMEILHSLPLLGGTARESDASAFDPGRWLTADRRLREGDFDPFLGGARRCPGKKLILFVCKGALAVLLAERRVTIEGMALQRDTLPPEFPTREIRFRQA